MNPPPDYKFYDEEVFDTQEFEDIEEKIEKLAIDSGLKKVNALKFSRQVKKQLELFEDEEEGLRFEDFKAMLEP